MLGQHVPRLFNRYFAMAYGLGDGPHGTRFTTLGAAREKPIATMASVKRRTLNPVKSEGILC